MIVPDDEMPVTEDGLKVEALLNPLGVLNRLNLAQIIEQHINFMCHNLVEELKTIDNLFDMEDLLFAFMKIIKPKQYYFLDMEYMVMNRSQKYDFFDDVIENGMYIHQTPFVDNTSLEEFAEIFKMFPQLVKKYKFKNIEKKMVLGDMYFIRLKHDASNKTSIRSTGLNNIKDLPSKSTLKKQKKILVSQTPIRLGEMEVTNLMMAKRGDIVEKLLKTYSTSSNNRTTLIEDLLTSKTPLNLDVQLDQEQSINRQILEKYFNILDLGLDD